MQANPRLPMKNPIVSTTACCPHEENSQTLLMEKMGMSKREIQEVYLKYGVTASKLVELMQLSKYQFIYGQSRWVMRTLYRNYKVTSGHVVNCFLIRRK